MSVSRCCKVLIIVLEEKSSTHSGTVPAANSRGNARWYIVAALFLVGANLRPALSSVAPVLSAIRASTALSAAEAGLLTTLPVLCFGVFAPLAPGLAGRFGADRVVLWGLLALAAALGVRIFFGIPGLFLGTLAAGASIGVVMVLLPGIIKREFGRGAGGMMGMYSMALCLGAAVAAGLTVPLLHAGGGSWRIALAFWLLPALAAAALWWPRLQHAEHHSRMGRYKVQGLWSNALAWQVTAFMGLQSALAYCVFGWLPTILIDRGMTPLAAGGVLSLSISLQLVTALGGPWIAGLARDQRLAIVVMMLLTLIGFIGCLYADIGSAWWWAIVLGLGQGGAFSIGLTLIVLRAPNATVAASLSGMVQGVGYTGAALGPFAFGLLRDFTHNWHAATILFTVVSVAALAAGLAAGRDRHVAVPVMEVR